MITFLLSKKALLKSILFPKKNYKILYEYAQREDNNVANKLFQIMPKNLEAL